ncbi:DUF2927 domain-containing protein [Roseovarius sp. SYSU LYC5161]|uniref:DUF2927 domain-containing protein n=1 Tax=Roseovarius halophilus (ex Wu et al. 2025) TaxID=3376060 RepID=UPI003999661C
MRARAVISALGGALGLLAVAGCNSLQGTADTAPRARPAALTPTDDATPSPRSQALAEYYKQLQADLLVRGLLRTDGGGVDTPYSDRDILNNFETLAFYDEYMQGAGFRRASGRAGGLRKWTQPVRIGIEFGDTVPEDQRAADRAMISRYAARLARVTRHPISVQRARANFHVLIMSADDRAQMVRTVRRLVPGIGPDSLDLFRGLPRSIHCFVVAFSAGEASYRYTRAVAFIRAEHPELMRRSCVHEELAQGLGLANDSPRARPSIFNDDDEFALLTSHDEELLRLLYDPALKPGMTPEQARPIAARILAGRSGPI